MSNVSLSKRENFRQFEGQTFAGTTKVIQKKAGSIMGLYLNLDAAGAITWHVSPDNTNWYAITPPLGTTFWSTPGTDPVAVPAEWLAFLAPYSYARMTFAGTQTAAVCIVELMA